MFFKFVAYVNMLWRPRESWGRFIGESIRFLIVIEGFPAPFPKQLRAPVLLFPTSTEMGACFIGELPEISKGPPEFELFCLAGHISSLGPGVSGGKTDQSATNKSSGFAWKKFNQNKLRIIHNRKGKWFTILFTINGTGLPFLIVSLLSMMLGWLENKSGSCLE